MIFVTLGILTLIISFVIALISLVKEQKEFPQKEVAQDTSLASADTQVNDTQVNDTQVNKPNTDLASQNLNHDSRLVTQNQKPAASSPSSEPFPWDKNFSETSGSEDAYNIEGKEIEEITKKLAQIKSEASLSQLSTAAGQNENNNSENQDNHANRLMGGFSLKDISNGSSQNEAG